MLKLAKKLYPIMKDSMGKGDSVTEIRTAIIRTRVKDFIQLTLLYTSYNK